MGNSAFIVGLVPMVSVAHLGVVVLASGFLNNEFVVVIVAFEVVVVTQGGQNIFAWLKKSLEKSPQYLLWF